VIEQVMLVPFRCQLFVGTSFSSNNTPLWTKVEPSIHIVVTISDNTYQWARYAGEDMSS